MSALFRRRRSADRLGDDFADLREDSEATDLPADAGLPADGDEELDPEAEDEEPEAPGLSSRPDGPWDVSEHSDTEGLIDLGALRLRGVDGMELRLEVEEATGLVTAATIQVKGSAVQLQAFAAPRSEGIWGEICAEIAAGITRQGGTADEVPGTFGRELLARIPVRAPDGRTGHQPARFVGIDGPRWLLRAVFHGPAAEQGEAAGAMEAIVRDVVVVRGPEAMAPRDLLPLRLPEAAGGPAPGAEDEQASERPPLEPFRRGPEITEIR